VADSSTIHLDRRLIETETLESALREIEDLPSVRESGAEVFVPEYEVSTHTGLIYPAKAYYPPWLMDESEPVVQAAVTAFREQLGREPEITTWQFSTNGVVTRGVFDIPTVGFGPGSEEHAHMPLDQVRVDDLVEAMAFCAAFVLKV
jgi:acetylornithine deacetylase/succinyl-diaminopimelate desuccinylase-like protein